MKRTTIIAIMMVVGIGLLIYGLGWLDGERGGTAVPIIGAALFFGGIGWLAAAQPSKKTP